MQVDLVGGQHLIQLFACNSDDTNLNHFNWWVSQVRVVDSFKTLAVSGLLALLHVKTDSCWSGWMRSTNSMTMKMLSASAVEYIREQTWHVQVLVIYCSLEVSSCNDSTCHWIKIPQTKTGGLRTLSRPFNVGVTIQEKLLLSSSLNQIILICRIKKKHDAKRKKLVNQ